MFRMVCALMVLVAFLSPVEANTLRNVVYGSHPKQAMDVYLPDLPQSAPMLVMLHGGAWKIGDKGNRRVWKAKAEYWGDKGFIVISVNTRLLPDASPVEQTQDLARAIAFIQGQAQDWGGDAGQLVLMGHSAGGHVVSLLSAREDIRRAAGLRPWKGTVGLDAGGLDVETAMKGNPARVYQNAFGTDPAFWAAANPSAHVNRGEGPFLIVCSTRRASVCQDGERFSESAGGASILRVNMSHSAINSELGKVSSYTDAVDRWIMRALGNQY